MPAPKGKLLHTITALYYLLNFSLYHTQRALYELDLISPDIRKAYDIFIVRNLSDGPSIIESGTEFADRNSEAAITLATSPSGYFTPISTTHFRAVCIIHVWDLEGAARALKSIEAGLQEWIWLILTHEEITNETLPELREYLNQDGGPIFTMLSLVFVMDHRGPLPSVLGMDPATVSGIEVYGIQGELQLSLQEIQIPIHTRWISAVHSKRNLQMALLKIVAMPFNLLEGTNPDLLYIDFTKDNKPVLRGGYEKAIITFLESALNFTKVVILGTGFVKKSENGSLTGIAAQVISNEADISIVSSELLIERVEQLSFLFPTYESKVFAFIENQPNNAFRNVYLKAFENSIWYLLLGTWSLLVCTMLALFWLQKVLPIRVDEEDKCFADETGIWAVGTVCQEGWEYTPGSSSLRIAVITGQFLGVVTFIAFGAALVSILSAEETFIHSGEDLSHYGYEYFSDENFLSTKYILKGVEHPKGTDMVPGSKSISPQGFLQLTKTHKLPAFLSVLDSIYPALRLLKQNQTGKSPGQVDEDICSEVTQVPVGWNSVKSGMFLKKGSPLRTFFNQKIVLMMESGLKRRYFAYFLRKSSVQCQRVSSVVNAMEFRDVWSAFVLLWIGVVTSATVLCVERRYFYWGNVVQS